MEVYFQSDIGKRRKSNQDYTATFTNQKNQLLALLADGMGGHQAGDIASRQAVEEIGIAWEATTIDDSEKAVQWFLQHIQQANQRIFEKGQSQPTLSGMGTTLEVVTLLDNHLALAHVGDSRIYLFREQRLIALTEDHSLVNALLKSGEITQEMAENHPRKNIITRSLGMPGSLEVDVAIHKIEDHDQLLLCSDGLTNMVSEPKIAQILLEAASLQDASQRLIEEANAKGGLDNITVLLIDVGGESQ
ncbi:Stp1/IreP family PP2C-type Ser/Thr phosphatase [Enterococcus aquimarinus]|uniref:protein-serine/threonine phosphatase n=1 Tax=Enterococcus aquimarinus TaxID=328396 RepID=A0A1L8QU22_9ENTE|nr:Stp1/IreP family PP2C-type Ser/Thr phosphatase [Enterococcus aquimarinus]OJG10997.1 serine/threonine protein phosphatase [Enterococcus aquimarinus]